jgi:microcystin-dependent protein
MDGVPTQTEGVSEILASDWNTYVRDNFDTIKHGHIVCTSSTRPSGVDEGTMIYESDTNLIYVYNGSSFSQNNLTPVGMLSPFAGSSAPDGWLLCHGQAVSQTTYAALFALIGSTYDVTSPGAGNFRVPDLRGRVIAGVDNMGGSDAGRLSWQNVLGTVGPSSISTDGGVQTHTLVTGEIPSHTHTITDGAGAHAHSFNFWFNRITNNTTGGGGNAVSGIDMNSGNTLSASRDTGSAGGHNHTINSAGGDGAHNNMQPTMLLNYIIKV